jgi:acyl carrier protein
VMVREIRGNKQLVGYFVRRGEVGVGVEGLRSYLGERLPEYMVPGVWVEMEEMPLTVNGKLDRRGLPEAEEGRAELEGGYEEPRTEVEKKLAEIWVEVLGVERVGIHDNFFDLGGQSLLATQVISRTRKLLHIDVPLRRLFDLPTIAELAEIIVDTHAKQEQTILANELAELQQLSETEAQELLEEGLRAGLVQ